MPVISSFYGIDIKLYFRDLPLIAVIPFLLLVHCAIGVPLTFAWRRTGNLSGPALGHAFVDALRNGLSLGL